MPPFLQQKIEKYLKLTTRIKQGSSRNHINIYKRLKCLQRYERQLKLAGYTGLLGMALMSPNQQLTAQCTPQGSEFQVNTHATSSQNSPSIAMDSAGDFVITWHSAGQDGGGYGIFAQRYNAMGIAQGSEFQVNTYTIDHQRFPSIAMDSAGDFVITWHSYGQDGSGSGIYGQRYTALGVAQGSEFQVNTHTTNSQLNPSIAMDSAGDFVITWHSAGQDGSFTGIYAQRYNSLGVAQGSEFKVNSYTTNYQLEPSIAMDSDGDFVITWYSYGQDGSYYGIFAQRYNAMGIAQGSEFQVNTHTTNSQNKPSIAMDSDGDFVIAWNSYDQDGDYWGVYAQRYNALGVAQGSEFLVNTHTESYQFEPSIVLDSDGGFVIAWSNDNLGAGFSEIHAQQYDAQGMAQGSEFQVNTYTTNSQRFPSIAMDSDRNFAIAWDSEGQDGDFKGIYAQQYCCPISWYKDTDMDGYGDPAVSVESCTQPTGYVDNSIDGCPDDGSLQSPLTWYEDADMDGYGDPAVSMESCTQPTGYVDNSTDGCPDNGSLQSPATWYADTDMDGYGDPAVSVESCTQPTGFVENSTDGCPDNGNLQSPATWYADTDMDGYGDPAVSVESCTQPVGYVDNAMDDCPIVSGLLGSPCDDGNQYTIDDFLDANCECVGGQTIPTLGQWGVLLLGLIFFILGTVGIQVKKLIPGKKKEV